MVLGFTYSSTRFNEAPWNTLTCDYDTFSLVDIKRKEQLVGTTSTTTTTTTVLNYNP